MKMSLFDHLSPGLPIDDTEVETVQNVEVNVNSAVSSSFVHKNVRCGQTSAWRMVRSGVKKSFNELCPASVENKILSKLKQNHNRHVFVRYVWAGNWKGWSRCSYLTLKW